MVEKEGDTELEVVFEVWGGLHLCEELANVRMELLGTDLLPLATSCAASVTYVSAFFFRPLVHAATGPLFLVDIPPQ
jgi:hypothetical protein